MECRSFHIYNTPCSVINIDYLKQSTNREIACIYLNIMYRDSIFCRKTLTKYCIYGNLHTFEKKVKFNVEQTYMYIPSYVVYAYL